MINTFPKNEAPSALVFTNHNTRSTKSSADSSPQRLQPNHVDSISNTNESYTFPLNGRFIHFNKEKLLTYYQQHSNTELIKGVRRELKAQLKSVNKLDRLKHPQRTLRMMDILSHLKQPKSHQEGKIHSRYQSNNQIVQILMEEGRQQHAQLERSLAIARTINTAVCATIEEWRANHQSTAITLTPVEIEQIKSKVLDAVITKFELTDEHINLKDSSPYTAYHVAMNSYNKAIKTIDFNTQGLTESQKRENAQSMTKEINTIITTLGNNIINHVMTEFENGKVFNLHEIKQCALEVTQEQLNHLTPCASTKSTANIPQPTQLQFSTYGIHGEYDEITDV
ncbi:hypothetical protein MWH14_03815 [Providencia stuartii]|uniref:hypothetical protein n=1 Tax=Providencia stuartii TaxID=588 RepID=UPI002020FA1D|nr:hypothetical protein [Providencia stuartii]ELR5044506.1 hypothetical protein [Providencia rettgeri]URE79460.1 hypothetical protein MWH14_03815 [Providencia stuartii]